MTTLARIVLAVVLNALWNLLLDPQTHILIVAVIISVLAMLAPQD